ncbi:MULTISPECIES: conjugative transposon protein TraJ [Sphingobacterium]|uniref:conjugative transposon protein TraJ n=1 Tax=Sphingobacterium TaxID=28453 RepID=UPI0028B1D202|nr:conjugative transposon protein TraJ [Sphingobacterium multivorum]
MKSWSRVAILAIVGLVLPIFTQAQGLAEQINGLHGVLDQLYDEMMPSCNQLIGVGSGLAAFAALFYIGHRVWKHIANAEPIDFYPLFRPFVLGFCILNFSMILGLINGVMKPTVTGTAAMVQNSNKAIEVLLAQKEEALKKTSKWQMYVGADGSGDREKWLKYKYGIDADDEGWFEAVGNKIDFAMEKAGYNFRNSVKEWMSQVLEILFQAASLCINTLRTFQLIVLAILGPLVFGLAVFDGFQHTLTVWLARYINIFLWLPVANIFGAIIAKIQELMIQLDISQIGKEGDTFFSETDVGYLIFLIIGIVGYFTVPSVANYIVHAAGGGALQQKASTIFTGAASSAVGTGAAMVGSGVMAGASMAADGMGNAANTLTSDMASQNQSAPYFEDKLKGK